MQKLSILASYVASPIDFDTIALVLEDLHDILRPIPTFRVIASLVLDEASTSK